MILCYRGFKIDIGITCHSANYAFNLALSFIDRPQISIFSLTLFSENQKWFQILSVDLKVSGFKFYALPVRQKLNRLFTS